MNLTLTKRILDCRSCELFTEIRGRPFWYNLIGTRIFYSPYYTTDRWAVGAEDQDDAVAEWSGTNFEDLLSYIEDPDLFNFLIFNIDIFRKL